MNFVQRVLSDGDQPSASRVMSMIFALATVGWVTYLVKINHALPDFAGLALLIGVPYGLNVGAKAATAFSAAKGTN